MCTYKNKIHLGFLFCSDRQVILGNHRDAWVFGAVDPNSGTASLMSLAKVIGQLRKDSCKFYITQHQRDTCLSVCTYVLFLFCQHGDLEGP